jgi:hypothetical protein
MGQERFAEVVFLRLALPGQPERNVGLFLLDRETGNLYVRVRDDWDRIVAPDMPNCSRNSPAIFNTAFRSSRTAAANGSSHRSKSSCRIC